jgi:hypothetical protein
MDCWPGWGWPAIVLTTTYKEAKQIFYTDFPPNIKKWIFQGANNTTAGLIFGSKVSMVPLETKALRPLSEL